MHLGMIMLDKIILGDFTKNFWKSINDISAIKLYFKFKPIRESCRGKIQMMFQDNPVLSLRCGGHPNDSMKVFFSSSSSLTRDFPFFS